MDTRSLMWGRDHITPSQPLCPVHRPREAGQGTVRRTRDLRFNPPWLAVWTWSLGNLSESHLSLLQNEHNYRVTVSQLKSGNSCQGLASSEVSGCQLWSGPVHLLFPKPHLLYSIICQQLRGGFPHSSVGKESVRNAGDPGSISGSVRSPGEGIGYPFQYSWASLVAQLVKNLPAMPVTWVQSLGWEDPLEKAKATHSSILAWRIPYSSWGHKESDTTEWLSLSRGGLPRKAGTSPNSVAVCSGGL